MSHKGSGKPQKCSFLDPLSLYLRINHKCGENSLGTLPPTSPCDSLPASTATETPHQGFYMTSFPFVKLLPWMLDDNVLTLGGEVRWEGEGKETKQGKRI